MNIQEIEKKILEFWQNNKIFEKTLKKTKKDKLYVFYDGPPFATGLPHYGHILSSVIKDVVPRYWTMRGCRVPRRWGWDCHGLPIENLIEKKLKVSGKKQIENKIGVDKFNEACRQGVLMYTQEWKKMVDRIGRWIEFDNAYKTMDSTYMESVWWALKTIWDKGLIYEGRKVLMYCPRCETPISRAEVAMDDSYKDITEESVTIKFKVKEPQKHNLPENTYILAWTTTPWTLPANVALAVGKDIDYSILELKASLRRDITDGEMILEPGYYIIASDRVSYLTKEGNHFTDNICHIKGRDLLGIEYEPLMDIPAIKKTGKKVWYVTDADFVTIEDGTGIVHTAVVYGEEDYNLGLKKDLPIVPLLNEKGYFNKQAPELIRGKYFKDAEKDIKKYLKEQKLLFKSENCTHSYPHCWRCDTQLFYNAISAWFIDVQKIKDRLIELNEKINWYPEHLKHGRFLNILETAPDWNISRNRYWATPLPFWKCDNRECGHIECVGSVKELKQKASNFEEVYLIDKIEEMDLHKHLVDKIKLKCEKCGKKMTRVSEVVDCWIESASMPLAEHHYPFENKEVFKKRYPGQYIAEYIAQTRAWFYYMHVMGTLLFNEISFENCVTTGTILNEKGEKLSKSKHNFTDPWDIINQYGADSLRYYLMSSVVMRADNLFFNDREVRDIYNKVVILLLNVFSFYKMYEMDIKTDSGSNDVLDKWILSKVESLKKEITDAYNKYDLIKASRPIESFVNDLSTWYLRRSRERIKSSFAKASEDKDAIKTLKYVLIELSKTMAPVMPFIADYIYREIHFNQTERSTKRSDQPSSIHLCNWPKVNEKLIDKKLEEKMEKVREIVSLALQKRAEHKIGIRQPLAKLTVNIEQRTMNSELLDLIKDEVNIQEIVFGKTIKLDTKLTNELKEQGLVREFIRSVQAERKKQGLTPKDKIKVIFGNEEIKEIIEKNQGQIKKSVIAIDIVFEGGKPLTISVDLL